MKPKKPSKPAQITVPVPSPVPEGSVFAHFIKEGVAAIRELEARRAFDDQATEFIKKKGLVAEFEQWRVDSKTPA